MYTAVGFLHPDRAEMTGRCCNLGGGGGQAGVEFSALQTLDSPVPASGGRITVDREEVGARPAGKEAESHHRFPCAIVKAAGRPMITRLCGQ